LPIVESPSVISPYWTARSTENFEDAPIQVIEYADLLCSDCLYLHEQMVQLKEEFKGKINVVFQFFPLDAQCNQVVEKDKHPGACDLSYMAAYDPAKFNAIHDEVFANFQAAKTEEWRAELARKYGVEAALEDAETIALLQSLIETGSEYEKTSEMYSHGIRSTPTMILNNRMVIGTFPIEQLRAIFQALVDEHDGGEKFMENWM
jgi:protein-disulfide isomerase